jgi:thiol-disulfide isomerase/thioredoxin
LTALLNRYLDLARGRAAAFARRALFGLLALAVIPAWLAACNRTEAPSVPAAAEPKAPTALSLEEFQALLEGALGQVAVVNFWATWCPPCVHEMPELAKFYNQYKDKGVVFLSISADSESDLNEGKVAAFMREHELPFEARVITSRDPSSFSVILKTEWSGTLPATFVYGPDGALAKAWEGEVTADDLAQVVDPLLGGAAHRSEG